MAARSPGAWRGRSSVDRLVPGQHWADFTVPFGRGGAVRLRSRVWLEPGLETSVCAHGPPRPAPGLQQVGAVALYGPGPWGLSQRRLLRWQRARRRQVTIAPDTPTTRLLTRLFYPDNGGNKNTNYDNDGPDNDRAATLLPQPDGAATA